MAIIHLHFPLMHPNYLFHKRCPAPFLSCENKDPVYETHTYFIIGWQLSLLYFYGNFRSTEYHQYSFVYSWIKLFFFCSKDVLFRVAKAASEEVRARNNDFVGRKQYGVHTGLTCFAPVINIMRHPLWGRSQVIGSPRSLSINHKCYFRSVQGLESESLALLG